METDPRRAGGPGNESGPRHGEVGEAPRVRAARTASRSRLRWRLAVETLRRMLREEWRMYAGLFGGCKYATFPVVVLVLCGVAVQGLVTIGVESRTLLAGIHGLAVLFGGQTGPVGVVGGDAVGDRLGEATLVVQSGETLPVSDRFLLSAYFCKDVVFYSALFLAPVSVAVAPAVAPAGGTLATAPFRLPLLWASITGCFLTGAAAALALVGLWTRGASGRIAAGLATVAATALWLVGDVDPLGLTPHAWHADPTPGGVAWSGLPVVVLFGIGLWTYDLRGSKSTGVGRPRLRWIGARLPGAGGELVAKTLLDLSRSNGGLAKLPFSTAVLAAGAIGILAVVERLVGVAPSYPVVLGGVLGLTAMTSYVWLTAFDGREQYEDLPVDGERLVAAKFRAFLLTGVPTGLATYLVATAVAGAAPWPTVLGATLFVCVQVYLFGVTVRFAGLSGDEFLFDGTTFGTVAAAVVAGVVPVVTAGFVVETPGAVLATALLGWAATLAVLGRLAYRSATGRNVEAPEFR